MSSKKEVKFDADKEQQYLDFLSKRINSENYKNNVTPEEYEKTKQKYERVKLKMKLLRKK